MGYAYVGTVDTVLKGMEDAAEAPAGRLGVLPTLTTALVPHPKLMKSIETFWTKVMPRFH